MPLEWKGVMGRAKKLVKRGEKRSFTRLRIIKERSETSEKGREKQRERKWIGISSLVGREKERIVDI